jgi:hypothetical protein
MGGTTTDQPYGLAVDKDGNVSTPNGDGTNHIVCARHQHKEPEILYIRPMGRNAFYFLEYPKRLDGTYKGAKEPVGVYVYMVEAVMNEGRSVTKKGTVTLIR